MITQLSGEEAGLREQSPPHDSRPCYDFPVSIILHPHPTEYSDPNQPEPPRDFGNNALSPSQPYRVRLPTQTLKSPRNPSEVRLNDGVSLNELLLANGYAAFDFTDRFLSRDDRAR